MRQTAKDLEEKGGGLEKIMHGQEKLTDGNAFVTGRLEKMFAGLEKMTLIVAFAY